MPLVRSCYVPSMLFTLYTLCEVFKTQFLDCFECANSALHFHVPLSVNPLHTFMHSKYELLEMEMDYTDQIF